MHLLVVGSGGREHALAWKLAQSPRVTKIFVAPGNGGTAALGENLPIGIHEHDVLVAAARRLRIEFVVIGPDDALAAGLADRFAAEGMRVFGPCQAAARLEWSKAFAKDFMRRHGIPTADAAAFSDLGSAVAHCRAAARWPLVLKADGLAAGKGVVVAASAEAAEEALTAMMSAGRFGAAGERVVIEEFLEGPEASLHALVDGARAVLLPLAQDHKKLRDGNAGPNTGGMGTCSPPAAPVPAGFTERVEQEILAPFLAGLRADALDFRGLLFPGLMLTAQGPRVLEFNARFGDPETQVLLPRLRSDLLPILEATANGTLGTEPIAWDPRAAVCVILASEGYPDKPVTNRRIRGLEALANVPEVFVFHGGTRRADDGSIVTSGGRVVGITALGATVADARVRAYEAAAQVSFEGMQFRRDIGLVAPPAG